MARSLQTALRMSGRDAPAPDVVPSRVVGIGASAGGLESLEHLFSSLPADTGMAFCVIQHLSPDFRSVMDELIARHSPMPVHLAEDGMPVEAGHIYLMPQRKEMIIRDRRLALTDKDPAQGLSLPIDQFFRSLAQDAGPQSIAIVLSGSGSDGSRGIVDVKQGGGLVLAESPNSAKFDGMPLSAIATGVVDHTGVPRDLARVLCGLPPLDAEEAEPLADSAPMDAALRLLRDQFNIDFSLYKDGTPIEVSMTISPIVDRTGAMSRPSSRSIGRSAASASACRWRAASSSCTAARSRPTAPGPATAASSWSGSRCSAAPCRRGTRSSRRGRSAAGSCWSRISPTSARCSACCSRPASTS